MNIYKANLKKDFYYVLVFLGLLSVTILLTSKFPSNGWIFFGVLCVAFLSYSLLTVRLSEIHIDTQAALLIFIYRNYFNIIKKETYSLDTIEFTYKKQAVSLRSGIKNVCSIYLGDKQIAQIIPSRDGWDDDEVNEFVHGLIEVGIKRKFVGYSLKDVET